MDAIFVGKVSVAPKRHIPQIIEQLFVCSYCQLVEDCSQLVVPRAANIHLALSRCSREVEPVWGRKLYAPALQIGVSHFVMLLGRHLALAGRVTDSGDGQLAAQSY